MADDNSNGGSGSGGSEPLNLTSEQLTQVINSAITSHLKRLPDYGKIVEDRIAEALKGLKSAPAPTDDGAPKGGKQDPKVEALLAKLEEQQKITLQAQQQAEVARKQQREDRALADLRSSLAGKVRPDAVDDVASLMFHVKKMVEMDENGNALLKVKRPSPLPGFPEEEVLMPIADGVDHWAKSKAAAIYIPAAPPPGTQPQVGRSSRMVPSQQQGQTTPKFQGPAKSDAEKIQRAMAVEAALKQRQG